MIKEFGKDKIRPIFIYMDSLSDIVSILKYKKVPTNANTEYVKYAPKSTMYSMLESDSLYLFCSELSNDRTENRMIHLNKPQDTYITCFYHNNNFQNNSEPHNSSDVYSQWMSYCREGGAAFEFYFGQDFIDIAQIKNSEEKYDEILKKSPRIFDFSLICSNPKDSSDFIKYYTYPFRVQYFDNAVFSESTEENGKIDLDSNSFVLQIKDLAKDQKIGLEYVAPYFKHSGFVQESEARLAVIDMDNRLSQCINYMNKNDGTRIPYIILKFGDLDDLNRPCVFNGFDNYDSKSLQDKIQEFIKSIPRWKRNKNHPIIIPQGRNQEEVYNIFEKIIELEESQNKGNFRIICQGHLPIVKITLAPTQDRKEQKKMMEIFCKSKYWLRRVEICESDIPYNTQNNNHI